MADEEYNWDDYYKWIQGREPRQLLLEALKKFPAGESLHAIDLGCGDGTDVNDSWANEPDKTFHTEEQVRAMLDGLEIEFFHEMEEDGRAASGPKHWHLFTVIARKV